MAPLKKGTIHHVNQSCKPVDVEYHKVETINGLYNFYIDTTDQGAANYVLVASFPNTCFYFIKA